MTAPNPNDGTALHQRAEAHVPEDDGLSFQELVAVMRRRWKQLLGLPFVAALIALGITYLIPPTFTARTSFLPPQQSQSSAASAIASLGALSGLASAATGISSPGERYVTLLRSTTLSDRIIDQFKLIGVYDADFRVDARKELARNLRVTLGKKDGLIEIEVDDESPQRAAEMANRYTLELRQMSGNLALTEAQQRRAFFEQHLKESKDKLADSQRALEGSGFSLGALKAEPKATAEGYARLRAEVTASEIRLSLLQSTLADITPEVRQQQALVSAMRSRLAQFEKSAEGPVPGDYVGKYREFKYHETLFELYARQFEMARMDESRESPLFQVVDPATPPEKRSSPKRLFTAAASGVAAAFVLIGWCFISAVSQRSSSARRAVAHD